MACLGMENASGDFEVIDLCFAGLPPLVSTTTSAKGKETQDQDVEMTTPNDESSDQGDLWVALVSGLSAGSSSVPEDLKGQLLVEWLAGELGDLGVSFVFSHLAAKLVLFKRHWLIKSFGGGGKTVPGRRFQNRKDYFGRQQSVPARPK